jgi:hypothetical protein
MTATAIPNITFEVDAENTELNFYAGPEPRPGAYRAQLDDLSFEAKNRKGNPMLTARFKITSGEFAGWVGWDRIVLTPEAKFKMDQFLHALGKTKANLKQVMALAAKHPIVGIRVGNGTDQNGNPQLEIKRVFPADVLSGGDDDDTASADDSASEDPDADGGADDSAADDTATSEGGEEGYTKEELEELDLADLKAIADEWSITYTQRTKAPALIDKILAEQAGGDDGDDASGDAEGDGEGDAAGDDSTAEVYTKEELTDLELDDLKAIAEELGADANTTKKPILINRILKAQEAPF